MEEDPGIVIQLQLVENGWLVAIGGGPPVQHPAGFLMPAPPDLFVAHTVPEMLDIVREILVESEEDEAVVTPVPEYVRLAFEGPIEGFNDEPKPKPPLLF